MENEATAVVENPYGLTALWEQGDFVAKGTLIIMAGSMQQHWQHEVPKTKQPVGERINLTFRQITNSAAPG